MRAISSIFGSLLLVYSTISMADGASEAYRALGVKPQKVLSGTVINSKVVPGGGKQVVCIATYLTGKKGKSDAVNIKLGVFVPREVGLDPVYLRDLGAERGGYIDRGDLQLLDLDGNGINEIVVTFDSYEDPLIEQKLSEVIIYGESGFATAWSGAVEYDATKAARNVPEQRRDRFVRELDLPNTLRTRGVTLFFNKKMIAVAGERLAEPKMVEETFPLREAPDHW
jgi:hypothetical protein